MTSLNPKPKFSAMLLEVADGYLQMGKTLAHRQNLLRSAVTAWNIACLSKPEREDAIRDYLKQYRHYNPTYNQSDIYDFEDDIRKLIEQKDRLYPDVKNQILGCHIVMINGKEGVSVQLVSNES